MQPHFNIKQVRMIIGLGNPDEEYQNTYHNAGFLFIDHLSDKKPAISNFSAEGGSASGGQFLISKTNTYMNKSGGFVKKILAKNKIKPERLLIVHDDSDLPLGRYKLSFGSGSAGHKGAESVAKALRTKNFWRLRIGIRNKELGIRQKAGKFVLKKITAADKEVLEEVSSKILLRFPF